MLFSYFSRIFPILPHQTKAKRQYNTIYTGIPRRIIIMRHKRDLAENVWYGVATAINIGEPLLQLWWAKVIFCRVLIEAKKRFDFEICGLVLDKAWLSFYIKPADGLKLPEIMQWM
jgi:hypothetical protein